MKTNAWMRLLAAIVVIASLCGGVAVAANQDAPGLNRVPVFVGFRQVPGPAEQALVRSHGGEIKYSYTLVPAIAASIPEPAIEGLRRNPNVTLVEPDIEVFAVADQLPWGVDRIDAELVHAGGNKGAGVKVAIIDSGVDYTHPDLDANFDPANRGYDYVNGDNDPMDDHGHGTHVAGTVAAEENGSGVVGVAPAADLYALKVLSANGVGYYSAIVAALNWCVYGLDGIPSADDPGIQVTNNSYGSSGYPGSTAEAAFANAAAKGIINVCAAGNSGNSAGTGDNVIYPGRFASCIAVAATNSSDVRASFSSTGSTVEIAAPGVSILSTYPGGGYAYMSGTSMACPHVAGTAALVIAAGLGNVRTRLQQTADYLGNPLWYGYGLVDADEAAGTSAPPPENDPPIASFSYTVDGLILTCTDTSTDPDGFIVAWNWSFGDGGTSTARNPSHTYSASGTYTVTLTVTDDDDATDTASADVTVSAAIPNDPPVASFSYTVDGLTVTCTDTSTDSDGFIVARNWSFGDGDTSTAQNPIHTYTASGTYTITLTVWDDDYAMDSDIATVTVSAPLPADTMHVGDIDATSVKLSKGQWQAVGTIRIHDASHGPVAGARVYGTFYQRGVPVLAGVSSLSGSAGLCTVDSGALKGGSATFVVDDVSHATMSYHSAGNHDPDGDSDGTAIDISK